MAGRPRTDHKQGRQNRAPKARFNLRWSVANYDYLCKLAMERGVSIAVVANEIVQKKRLAGNN